MTHQTSDHKASSMKTPYALEKGKRGRKEHEYGLAIL